MKRIIEQLNRIDSRDVLNLTLVISLSALVFNAILFFTRLYELHPTKKTMCGEIGYVDAQKMAQLYRSDPVKYVAYSRLDANRDGEACENYK